jgi:hypothetical protein
MPETVKYIVGLNRDTQGVDAPTMLDVSAVVTSVSLASGKKGTVEDAGYICGFGVGDLGSRSRGREGNERASHHYGKPEVFPKE